MSCFKKRYGAAEATHVIRCFLHVLEYLQGRDRAHVTPRNNTLHGRI
jgi:hypothetical protein